MNEQTFKASLIFHAGFSPALLSTSFSIFLNTFCGQILPDPFEANFIRTLSQQQKINKNKNLKLFSRFCKTQVAVSSKSSLCPSGGTPIITTGVLCIKGKQKKKAFSLAASPERRDTVNLNCSVYSSG